MLHRFMLLLPLFAALGASAQQPASSKTTEKEKDNQIDYKQVGAPLPSFRLFVCRDSFDDQRKEILTNNDLDNGANLFVMIFNPTCSHCQDETAVLEKSIDLFHKSRLVLTATPLMKPYMPDFLHLLHISNYPQITAGVDSAGYMDKVFLYQMLPQINIYDRNRKLLKIYTGEVSVDSLKQYIE